jgi:hypothetical protein
MIQSRVFSDTSGTKIGGTELPSKGLWFLFSILALTWGSCAPLPVDKIHWDWEKLAELQPPQPKTPDYMVDIWTDTVLSQPGQPAIRGFGGRILFYQNSHDKPVVVDGTLTVYVFEENEAGNFDTKPTCKYVFLPEHLSRYYSRSKLGHSYSVWIPFDEAGSPRCEVMLLARFEDARSGKVIVSKPVRKSLPGPASQEQKFKTENRKTWAWGTKDSQPGLPSTTERGPEASARPQVESTTIDLPPAVAAKVLGLTSPQLPYPKTSEARTDSSRPISTQGENSAVMPEDPSQNTSSSTGPSAYGNFGFENYRPWPGEIDEISTAQSTGQPSREVQCGGGEIASGKQGRPTRPEFTRSWPPLGADRNLHSPARADPRQSAPAGLRAEFADPPQETLQTGQKVGNRRPLQLPVQRGPIVVPSFSPGRTQPHPVVWPGRHPAEPEWFLPYPEPTDPEAAGLSTLSGSENPNW